MDNHREEHLYEAPFDDADADLILHSADGKHFRVFKVILRKASTFFADMFTFPAPRELDPATPQDVTMAEDGATLDRLLRMCYPVEEPDFTNLTLADIASLLVAADKYGMPVISQRCAKSLEAHTSSQPLSVFLIATSVKLDAVALAAARECLRRPQSYLVHTTVPEIDMIHTSEYRRLLQYHDNCTQAVVAQLGSATFANGIPGASQSCWNNCQRCQVVTRGGVRVTHWWNTFMYNAVGNVRQSGPLGLFLKEITWASPGDTFVCGKCNSGAMINQMMNFVKELQAAIEKIVFEIQL